MKIKAWFLLKTSEQKLIMDILFKPSECNPGEELFLNGIFEFNISKMIEFIRGNKQEIPLEEIDVKGYHTEAFSSVNESHLSNVDINSPIILIEINPDRFIVVDGHHRLAKAYRNGINTIMAYKLTVKQHIQFLTSVRAYRAFIDYWNEKVSYNERETNLKR